MINIWEQINNGYYSDAYFNRTKEILEKDNKHPNILMQVFSRSAGILCGINEAIYNIKRCVDKLKIKSLDEGSKIQCNETVMTIEGDYSTFAHLETVYLGTLARETSIATAVNNIISVAQDKTVIFMPARFEHYITQTIDGYAAYIGGCRNFSTEANCMAFPDIKAMGTMPHALIAAYNGNTVEAALAFDKYIDPSVPRVILVDFENDCVKTSLEAAEALKDKLYAVRLDTSANMTDKSLMKYPQWNEERNINGVCPKLVTKVRTALDEAGYPNVKIVVSGGFDKEKVSKFIRENVPFDAVGIGSDMLKHRIDYTADIVELDGKPCAKVGRKLNPNLKLKDR
jgi:nicotinate phosphoribosyltransferase